MRIFTIRDVVPVPADPVIGDDLIAEVSDSLYPDDYHYYFLRSGDAPYLISDVQYHASRLRGRWVSRLPVWFALAVEFRKALIEADFISQAPNVLIQLIPNCHVVANFRRTSRG